MTVYLNTIPEDTAAFYGIKPGGYIATKIDNFGNAWNGLNQDEKDALLGVWQKSAPETEEASDEFEESFETLLAVGEKSDVLKEYVALNRATAKQIAVKLLAEWSASDANKTTSAGDKGERTQLDALQEATGQSWRTILLWVSESVEIGKTPTTPKAGAVDKAVWGLVSKKATK